ncbi:MAG: sigma-70 family RNA polymerase sigma factor [Synergistaceae bacterium]|jgi:RNA polymerase sporulation-specific sigma factor|nr:sigma-70 family RNA polymerase sigma factor [Synergistaceae bacterium]
MSEDHNNEQTLKKIKEKHEADLWMACSNGDDEAREELILSYRPMVYWLAKNYKVSYSSYPDMIQEGMLALIKAVDGFDISRNNRFSTYAYYKIKGSLINFLQRVEGKAPVPADEVAFIKKSMRQSLLSNDAISAEWSVDLEKAIADLSKKESDILKALVLDQRAAKEVASEIKIDVSHVYRIRRNALSKLRQWLENEVLKTTSTP